MTTANIDIVNKGLNSVFLNTEENDIAIYPAASNQSIHLGCVTGSTNSALEVTRSNVEVSVPLVCAAQISADNLGIFRNRIINGGMQISQRNGTTSTAVAVSSLSYPVDRMILELFNAGTYNTIQSTDVPTNTSFTNSLMVSLTGQQATLAAGAYAIISQRIEGYNVADFMFGTSSATPITISFWTKSSVIGTYGMYVDSTLAQDTCYVTSFNITAVDTWEKHVITVPGATVGTWVKNNATGLKFGITLAAGTSFTTSSTGTWLTNSTMLKPPAGINFAAGAVNSAFRTTGWQLEKGTIATPFEFRPYPIELQLCLRYFEKLSTQLLGTTPGGTGDSRVVWYFKVAKRVTPTFTYPVSPTSNGIPDGFTEDMAQWYVNSNFVVIRQGTTASAELA